MSRSRPTARRPRATALPIGDIQKVIATALGGTVVTTTVEGRERYSVILRYPRDFRDDPQAIAVPGAGADHERRHGAARARSRASR